MLYIYNLNSTYYNNIIKINVIIIKLGVPISRFRPEEKINIRFYANINRRI